MLELTQQYYFSQFLLFQPWILSHLSTGSGDIFVTKNQAQGMRAKAPQVEHGAFPYDSVRWKSQPITEKHEWKTVKVDLGGCRIRGKMVFPNRRCAAWQCKHDSFSCQHSDRFECMFTLSNLILSSSQVDLVVASPLTRALQTATAARFSVI